MHSNNNNNHVQTENTEAHGVKGLVAKVKAVLPGHKESPATTAHREHDINHNTSTTSTTAAAAGPHIGNTGPHGGFQDTTTANSMLPGHNHHHNNNNNITQDAYGVNQQNQHNVVPGTSGKIAHSTEKLPHAKGMLANTTAAHLAEAEAANAEFARTHGNQTGGVMDHGQLRYGEHLANQGQQHQHHGHGHHDQLNNNNNNNNTHHNHEAAYGAAGAAGVAAAAAGHHNHDNHNDNLTHANDQHHLAGMQHHNATTVDQAGMAAAQGAAGYPTGKADNLNTVHHIHHQGAPINTTPYMDNHAAPNAEFRGQTNTNNGQY
ncbi:hypothetical protein HDU89_005382 [Geranomyces variabilis]|nr:hypothetical protein HDU89_005382 [Geranomyces variabilis]